MRKEHQEKTLDQYTEALDDLVQTLGGLCCQDLIFKKATTAIGLKRIVNRLIGDDYSVALDVRTQTGIHTVGLIPIEEGYFTLVSNHIPPKLQGVITLDALMPRLNIPNDRPMSRYPINDANITALPPLS